MTEDEFHLTPIDIRTQAFRRIMRGYDPAAVEEFRERVAAEVERLIREKAVNDERLRSFREQLKGFREREKATSDALVMAQELREEAEQSAEKEAEAILRDARIEAEALVKEARQAEQAVHRDIEAGHRQLNSYLASFRVLLERNLAEIEAVEGRERNGRPPMGPVDGRPSNRHSGPLPTEKT